MSNVDINVDINVDGRTDGRTPISHPATSRCDKNQYLAHMTKTLVICKKYTYYIIKFAHYYL